MGGESKAKMLTTIARNTGLQRETIKDLMKNGWYIHQTPDGVVFSKQKPV